MTRAQDDLEAQVEISTATALPCSTREEGKNDMKNGPNRRHATVRSLVQIDREVALSNSRGSRGSAESPGFGIVDYRSCARH